MKRFVVGGGLTALAIAAAVAAGLAGGISAPQTVGLMAILTVVGDALRIRRPGRETGFETAPLFLGVLLSGEVATAAIPVLAGMIISRGAELLFTRRGSFAGLLFETGRTSLSCIAGAAALVWVLSLGTSPWTFVAGSLLFAVFFLATRVLLTWVGRKSDLLPPQVSPLVDLRDQGRAFLLLGPFVALGGLLLPAMGNSAIAISFIPILVVGMLMRTEAEAEHRAAALSRRTRELDLIRKSYGKLLSAEGDEETFRRLIALISGLVPVQAAIAISWERGPARPLAMYRFGECQQSDTAIRGWAKESGLWNSVPPEPLVRHKDDRTLSLSGEENVVQASFGIATPEMLYGLVVIESTDEALADPEILNLLQLLVKETAVSLQDQLYRTELLSEKQESERNIQTLNKILSVSESLLTSTDADAILTGVARAIQDALGSNLVLIALSDDSDQFFVPRAHAGLDEVWKDIEPTPKREITQYFTREFAVAGCYFVPFTNLWSDDSLTFIREGAEGFSIQDWNSLDMILVPLVDEHQHTIGYISVRERGAGRAPGLNRIRALEIFGRQVVAALRSVRHYKAIEQLTRIDALTQVYNRRHFHEKLRDEIQRHQRHDRSFALLMADIDNFKMMNDTYGHQAGDDVLRQVAEEISKSLREIDVVSRFGGEEFAVILPEASLEGAIEVAERLRESIARRDFELRRGGLVHVTVSCGVAVFPTDAATQTELVAKADAALYVAKRRGKNQVIVA